MTLTRPTPGDPLSLSNGKSSTEILDEYADLIETHDESLVGPAFTSAEGYSSAAESLILDPETTANWVVVNGTLGTIDTALKTTGTASVRAQALKFCWDNNPDATAKFYVNLASPASRTGHTHIGLDVYHQATTSSFPNVIGDVYELVASDSVDLGGNVVVASIPHYTLEWKTLIVNCSPLTQVRSVGIRTKYVSTLGTNLSFQVNIDNIRWMAQTELEAALNDVPAAVVPPGYTPSVTQQILDVPSTQTVIDNRPQTNISRLGGVRNVRDFQYFIEDGSVDCTRAITDIFAQLEPGDYLEFPPNAIYKTESLTKSIKLRYLRDVTIDFRNSRFYSTVERDVPFFDLVGCRGVTLKNFRIFGGIIESWPASSDTNVVGTPATSGSNKLLTLINEEVRSPIVTWFGRDKDNQVRADITLSDSTHVANDCLIFMKDTLAPSTAPTAAVSGADGPIIAGTRFYAVTYVDGDGRETSLGPSVSYTGAGNGRVALSAIPVAPTRNPPVVERRIYRTTAGKTDFPQNFRGVGVIRDNTTTTWTDAASDIPDYPTVSTMVAADSGTAGNVDIGQHYWRVSYVDATGHETTASQVNSVGFSNCTVTLVRAAQVSLTAVPLGGVTITKRRIYRSKVGSQADAGNFLLVGEIADNTTTTFTDNVADASLGVPAGDAMEIWRAPVLPKRTLTLTSTPTVYSTYWDCREMLDAQIEFHIKKVTNSVNTITVGDHVTYGRVIYHSNFESGDGFLIGEDNHEITITDGQVEGVGGACVKAQGSNTSRGLVIRNLYSRANHQQSMVVNYGGRVRIQDCTIRESPRSGIDIEPEVGAWEVENDVYIDACDFYNITNAAIGMASTPRIRNVTISNCRQFGGGAQFIIGGAEEMRLANIWAPWGVITATARNLSASNVYSANLIGGDTGVGGYRGGYPSAGHNVSNVHFTEGQRIHPLNVQAPRGFVSNVSLTRDLPSGTAVPTGGPVRLNADTAWAIIDPGMWRTLYPSTFKGVGAGSLWEPRGKDMKDEGLLATRSLSGTSTRGNNLRGLNIAMTAGNTTATVTFPTRSLTNLTIFNITNVAQPGGALALTQYFYRVASRHITGGPIVGLAEKSVTLSGANNAVGIAMQGLAHAPFYAEAFTIYRGTAAGVYTARYDLVPNQDWHGLTDNGTVPMVYDLGTTCRLNNASGGEVWGFADSTSQTSTASHPSWTGSAWTVQDETGYEPDATYALMLETSWQTTWKASAKRMNGFDLEFGTPVPVGGGTLSWFLVR